MGLPSERGRWGCFPSGAGCLPSSGSAQQSRPRLRWALWWPTNASWGPAGTRTARAMGPTPLPVDS